MADEKKYLRQILRESRVALSKARVRANAAVVQQRLLRAEFYRRAATVVLYAAKDNEVPTDAIFADALVSGRRILFPRIVPSSHDLALIIVRDRGQLVPGAYGLLEPTGAELVPPAELGRALICVPGVAFSRAGQRLGRGGGYYDRLLAAVGPQSVTAGLAWSFQVLDWLPESPGDRRLNFIVTESALHAAGHAPRPVASGTEQGGAPRC